MSPMSPTPPAPPLIKVCGMRDAENIREVEALGIDLMGFIFWPKSSRYVSERPFYMPAQCKRVGVFVDASIDDILQHIAYYALDLVQLHGHGAPISSAPCVLMSVPLSSSRPSTSPQKWI